MKYFELTSENTESYSNAEAGEVLLFTEDADDLKVVKEYFENDEKCKERKIEFKEKTLYDIPKKKLDEIKKLGNFTKITKMSDVKELMKEKDPKGSCPSVAFFKPKPNTPFGFGTATVDQNDKISY